MIRNKEDKIRLSVKEFLNDDPYVGSSFQTHIPSTVEYTEECLACDDPNEFSAWSSDIVFKISDCYRVIEMSIGIEASRKQFKLDLAKLDKLVVRLLQVRDAAIAERKLFRKRKAHHEQLMAKAKMAKAKKDNQ